jgi:hypothetical protein
MKAINQAGFLAVATDPMPEYDRPVMIRLVWTTKHKWDDCYSDMRLITTLPQEGERQPWALESSMGGRISFYTDAKSAIPEIVGVIKPPRKTKGQSRPWRWEAGAWTKYYTPQLTGFERTPQ